MKNYLMWMFDSNIAFIFLSLDRYRIEVRTGDRVHSGTDASVYITLYGQSAHCGERQLDDSSNNFERYR